MSIWKGISPGFHSFWREQTNVSGRTFFRCYSKKFLAKTVWSSKLFMLFDFSVLPFQVKAFHAFHALGSIRRSWIESPQVKHMQTSNLGSLKVKLRMFCEFWSLIRRVRTKIEVHLWVGPHGGRHRWTWWWTGWRTCTWRWANRAPEPLGRLKRFNCFTFTCCFSYWLRSHVHKLFSLWNWWTFR